MNQKRFPVSLTAILPYQERERLKMISYQKYGDEARWHRFMDQMFDSVVPENLRFYIPSVHPSFEEYQRWLKDFPGWSYGSMGPRRSKQIPPLNGNGYPFNKYLMRLIKLCGDEYIVYYN